MRNLFIYTALWLTGAVTVVTSEISAPLTVWNHWYGGFVGEACFTAPYSIDGWIMRIEFDVDVQTLSNVWNANLIRKESNRVFILDNANYNGKLSAGRRVCPGFQGVTDHNTRTTATITVTPKTGTSDPETTPPQETTPPPAETTPTPVTEAPVQTNNPTTLAVTETPEQTNGPSDNSTGQFDYKEVLGLSILFYEAQRSGRLPDDNRIAYRGDSALDDKGDNGEDLTGGWYDAGDYVKFNLPMASSTTLLLWGLLRYSAAYTTSGELDNMYKSVKWPLDYFLKCWNPDRQEYYYQVGDGNIDHAYWGRAEDMTMHRPASKLTASNPGSDVAGETAAAMAAGSIAFATRDATYANQLQSSAKTLYQFAKTYQGKYPLTDFYKSYGYKDELCWAAMWLYKATGESHYLDDARGFYSSYLPWSLSWDEKGAVCQLMLYEETGENQYLQDVKRFVGDWISGSIPDTPCGLAYRDAWASLRYSANTALVALLAADDGINSDEYRTWAVEQINYMLGDNKMKMSYVIGYSETFPLRPHHASSSCPSPPATCDWPAFHSPSPNPHTLMGALVGGPNQQDEYLDDRSKYEYSEVACDYNAGFQSAVAGIIQLQLNNNLPNVAPRNC